MSNCGTCKNFMAFEKKGIKEVPGDGMCMKDPNSDNWVLMLLSHCCIDYKPSEEPVTIQPPLSPMDQAKAAIDKLQKPGPCKKCAKWHRIGFSMAGKCRQDMDNPNPTNENDTCPNFYSRPNDNAQAGDIIRISIGEQWKLLFVGKTHVVVEDRSGKQESFSQDGLRFEKC